MIFVPLMDNIFPSMLEVVTKVATVIPEDVLSAIESAYSEEDGPLSKSILGTILESSRLSNSSCLPICQDTGSVFVIIRSKADKSLIIKVSLINAIRKLTAEGILRQNCVEPLSGKNTTDNTGQHVPQVHIEHCDDDSTVSIMLKGGGSENVSSQYSLPDVTLNAGRDTEGVRRCILDAVFKAQGKGCSPGILGVCIGGDRASGYYIAKEQLFRRLDDISIENDLASLETRVLEDANSLGIGPMGLGGKATLLGVKIAGSCRHPASFFVTVSYSCWATRRYSVRLDSSGRIIQWL